MPNTFSPAEETGSYYHVTSQGIIKMQLTAPFHLEEREAQGGVAICIRLYG